MKGKKYNDICDSYMGYDLFKNLLHLLVKIKTMSVTMDRQFLI